MTAMNPETLSLHVEIRLMEKSNEKTNVTHTLFILNELRDTMKKIGEGSAESRVK